MQKISVKTIYLIFVISIGLVVLGAGSTFAMFTASSKIDNPISFSAGMKSESDTLETIEVTVLPGEVKSVNVNVNNSNTYGLNYIMWYINEGYNIDFGLKRTDSGSYQNVIDAGSTHAYEVSIRNNSSDTISVIIGVSSSRDSVVLGDEMVMIPQSEMPDYVSPLSDFEYVIGSFDELDDPSALPDDVILLTNYIGSSSKVGVPATYTVDGVTYNTALWSSSDDFSSGVFLSNTLIKNVYINDAVKIYYTDRDLYENYAYGLFADCTNLEYVSNIPSSVTDMYNTFFGCTSLVSAPTIPASVTSMSNTFRNCTSLTGDVNILSENITSVDNIFTGTSKAITVNVPNNTCSTYTKLNALTTSNGMPSNVTLKA